MRWNNCHRWNSGLNCECHEGADNLMHSCAWVSVSSWAAELLSRNLLLAGCNQCKLLVNFGNTWTKQKCHVLSSSKRNMSQKQLLGVWSHTSPCRLFRSGKHKAWSSGKRSYVSKGFWKEKHLWKKRREPEKVKVKNLVGRKIMEVIPETKDLTKTQLEMDVRGHPRTLACSNQHGSGWAVTW